jgi:uncharacterized protein (DUF924 family)
MQNRAQAILDFWFGSKQSSEYGKFRREWFSKDPAFDEAIRKNFLNDYIDAAAGKLTDWQKEKDTNLALIILLDQFPRNMFRNDARAYATDPLALATAKYAIARDFDQSAAIVERMFFYLPFEHSENLADQEQGITLYRKFTETHPEAAEALDYALQHHAIIKRFGRFPHRNAELGRTSTAEEIEFLKQPGSSF